MTSRTCTMASSSMAGVLLRSALFSKLKHHPVYTIVRNSSVPPRKKQKRGTIKHRNLISPAYESLASRGFLRSLKPYTPPKDVAEKINSICQSVLGPAYASETELSRENKFAVLNACFKELNHSVPNSLLHKIVSVGDVFEFYKTTSTTTVPFDELLNQDLPPNLYIQQDYIRFDPDNDKMFNGISAFPESSTIVTGLKYKGKYKGTKANSPDIYYNRAIFEKINPY